MTKTMREDKPNNSNDWRELTQFLIRKYLYIDPNDLYHWKKLAKMMGENCKVCGKPLVPNEYADEFENKLLDFISFELQSIFEEIDSCQMEDTDVVHPLLIKGFDWNKYADIRQKYLGKEEK